jgi:hypothetical protein
MAAEELPQFCQHPSQALLHRGVFVCALAEHRGAFAAMRGVVRRVLGRRRAGNGRRRAADAIDAVMAA